MQSQVMFVAELSQVIDGDEIRYFNYQCYLISLACV